MAHTLTWNLRTQLVAELAGFGLLAAVYLLAFPQRPRYLDLVLAGLAVAGIVATLPRSRAVWQRQPAAPLGPAAQRRAAWRSMGLFTAVAALALLAAAAWLSPSLRGPLGWLERVGNWHVLVAIALYLPWALLQQLVFLVYLLGRLLYLLPTGPAVALTAAAFSAVHFPRYPVMAVTAVAGVFWALNYRGYRTLAPIVLSHAVLGSLLHYWVFGRDLLRQWLGG
ncbi:MAG TPA: CPBP family glutamic-type intramembrane protease [Gammaproteobacteria bacterium]